MRVRRTVASVVAAVAAGGVVVPLAPSPASADVGVDQSYPVPTGGTYTMHGHGFGHGHGMSQYGAYGAARQGLDHRQILDFYYPGTSLSRVRGSVRVLISADTTSDVVVSAAPRLSVRDLGSHTRYLLPGLRHVTRWRLNVDSGRTVVGYYDGAWHRYRPGGAPYLVGDGQFHAAAPLTLWTPSGTSTYRGYLRAASPTPGSATRDTVNIVSLDSYVQGVLPAEMPTSWSAQALEAQAIAARTYAAWERDANAGRPSQICDTASCQVYRGYSAEDSRGNAAVAATLKQILTYDGAAAFTQFSSSSGGWTSAGSRPYLVAKADPYDDFTGNPVHDWTLRLSASRIATAYPSIGRLRRLHVTRRDGHGQWRGRVVTVVLDGTRHDVSLSGDAFQARFGLRSSWFAA
jgi:stage II sporulation protein D